MPPRLSPPERASAGRPEAALDSAAACRDSAVSLLDIRVGAGDAGPVVILSGEADMTTVGQLEDVLNAQIAAGARILTVDLSGLRFADSATIGALLRAARTVQSRGGRLDLASPQPALARTLTLLGVDEILTVHGGETGPGPGSACLPPGPG